LLWAWAAASRRYPEHADATDLPRHRDHRPDAVNGDRIIEIGCIEMVNRRLTGQNLHFYLNPERSSHPDAVKVHGLTDEFLADKPLFAEVADDLLAFLAGADIVIHNAGFDIGFLNAELKRLGVARLTDVVPASPTRC
jgi:DNA polymerase-3 subunit epsilon